MYLPAATVFLVSHLNRTPQEATALLHNDTGQVAYPETRASNDLSAVKVELIPMGLYVVEIMSGTQRVSKKLNLK